MRNVYSNSYKSSLLWYKVISKKSLSNNSFYSTNAIMFMSINLVKSS